MAAPRPTSPSFDTTQRLLLALAAFVVAFGLSALREGRGAPDFYVFWTAARHWQAPYDPGIIRSLEAQIRLGGVWPFAYPPTFLLFVAPFAAIPLPLAYPLWAGVESALFLYAASYLVRPIWATALLALAPVVFFSAELGQTSLIVGAALIGGWRLREARPVLAGLLLGLAACIKPQALLAAPVVFWGQWRLLAAMAATGALLALASLGFGLHLWLEWPRALAAFGTLVPQTDRINPSALLPSPWWTLGIGVFGLWLAATTRNLVGLVGGALCLTPYAHAYDLAPLAPVALGWLIEWRSRGWVYAVAGGALLAGLIATPAATLVFLLGVAILRPEALAWMRRFGFPWIATPAGERGAP